MYDFVTFVAAIDRYQFSIASLTNKKDLLQPNDPVQFSPALNEPNFATQMKCTREKQRAFVEAMKGTTILYFCYKLLNSRLCSSETEIIYFPLVITPIEITSYYCRS